MPKQPHYRTQSRELALQMLYQVDLRGQDLRHTIANYTDGLINVPKLLNPFLNDPEEYSLGLSTQPNGSETMHYAEQLFQGCFQHWQELDDKISMAHSNWKLSRISAVDRNILRIALFELLYKKDIAPEIVINEAVELAKKFSTENSGAFINGILDDVWKQIKAEPAKPPVTPET